MKVLVALPTYDDTTNSRQALSLYAARCDTLSVQIKTLQLSALCWCFNQLWADCLNDRTIDYFLLIHADIVPLAPVRWISKLIAEAERVHADLLSAVSPLKAPDGLTSTALVSQEHPKERRLALAEVYRLPETFKAAEVARLFGWESHSQIRLLVNTGCLLLDVRKHRNLWEEMYFKTVDRIERRGGKFVATFEPEDWNFSKQAAERGLLAAATRAVKLVHHGAVDYTNDQGWGTRLQDMEL
jgi:hypothetical protein